MSDGARAKSDKDKSARTRSGEAPPLAHASPGRLAAREIYYARLLRGAALSGSLVALTLAAGTVGYHAIEGMDWLDAFHQASLLLSGMGPVVDVKSTAGKLFDSIYALFCGVILLAASGLMLAPIIHRVLHRFRIEDSREP